MIFFNVPEPKENEILRQIFGQSKTVQAERKTIVFAFGVKNDMARWIIDASSLFSVYCDGIEWL